MRVGRVPWMTGASLALIVGCATGQDDATVAEEDTIQPDTPFSQAAAEAGRSDTRTDTMQDSGGPVLGEDADSGVPTQDAAPDTAAPAVCSTTVLGGIGIPMGSVATADRSYGAQTPDLAIDGRGDTLWNSGKSSGSLRITFPVPQTITGIRLGATASPASSETYAVYGYSSTLPVTGALIGTLTANVNGDTLVPPISVTPGTYSAILITVDTSSSWVAVLDVSLLTTACP